MTSGWFVELNDFEAFNAFVTRHGKVVFKPTNLPTDPFASLEIYDDYRE